MKEMEYKAELINEVLDSGNYKGYNYIIMSYGIHPCAYIEIPKEHKYYNQNYTDIDEDIDFQVNGGLTFGSFRDFGFGEKYYIGWDYAHCGDFSGYWLNKEYGIFDGKQWTTEQILEEVRTAIRQLVGE